MTRSLLTFVFKQRDQGCCEHQQTERGVTLLYVQSSVDFYLLKLSPSNYFFNIFVLIFYILYFIIKYIKILIF